MSVMPAANNNGAAVHHNQAKCVCVSRGVSNGNDAKGAFSHRHSKSAPIDYSLSLSLLSCGFAFVWAKIINIRGLEVVGLGWGARTQNR